jgi:hypothetical protein
MLQTEWFRYSLCHSAFLTLSTSLSPLTTVTGLPYGELHARACLPQLLIVRNDELVHLALLLQDEVQALLQLLLAGPGRPLDHGLPGPLSPVDLENRSQIDD